MRHVIIGGGIAGTTCAEEIRKRDADAEITLLSEESHAVYSRVLLPHYIKAKVPRERVFLKKETWYADQRIEWLRGVTATAIDPKNKFVATSEGREIEYDKLLVATGGDVRTVEEDRRGVSYFRTLDDADHLLQLLKETPAGSRCGIWGGGFIACEYLNIFAQFGMPTSLAMRGPWFWSNVFDEQSGTLLNERMRAGGVEVQPSATRPPEDAAILGVGIGIGPNFAIAREAGIEVGAGIKANEYLETNVPDVYTAGDIAEFFDPIVGRQMLIGNWLNAMTQGRVAAANMLGEKTACKLVSSYATNALGLEMIFVGDTSRKDAEEIVVVGSAANGGVTQVFLRGGRTVGATIVGRNADRAPITKAIQEKAKFIPV